MGDQELTVMPDNPQTEILASGAALVRLENMTQMQMAIQRPRDEKAILQAALAELDTYPSMAFEAIYEKPVGDGKTASGLSIRAAESLANRWSNSAHGVEQMKESDSDDIILSAVFLDYENNIRHVKTKRVSRLYKKAGSSQILQHSPDRFSDVVIPANESKALREIILRSLPAGLRKEYEKKAREIIGGGGDISGRLDKMVKSFKMIGVELPSIEAMRGKAIAEFNGEDLADMIGVFNAIRDEQTTVEEAFGAPVKKEDEPNLKPLVNKPEGNLL